MKTYAISAQTILSAAKHQWKRFLIVVLAFAVLGAAGGWLYAGRGSSETGGGGAAPLPAVNLASVARTQTYYADCLQTITDSYGLLEPYVNAALSAQLPEGGAEDARERLSAVTVKRREFQQNTLSPLQTALDENGAVYIPEEFMDALTAQYESRLSSIAFDLLSAETAAETIRQMASPNIESNSITGSYASLIGQAANYGELLKNRAIYESKLNLLRNESEQVRAQSREMERALEDAAAELNAILEEAGQAAREVGEAANMVFTLQPKGASYEVATAYTYRAASLTESFAAIELFCVLAGVCAGAFLAVCREAKKEKNAAEQAP